jgi:hypothetical protein
VVIILLGETVMGVSFEAKVYKYQGSLIMIDKYGKGFYLKPGDYAGEDIIMLVHEEDFVGNFILET